MKIKTIYTVLAATLFAASGCSSDQEPAAIEIMPQQSKEIRIEAYLGSETRIGLTPDGNDISVNWEDGDKITIVRGSDTFDFILDSGAGSHIATFVGTANFKTGDKLHAVYNKNDQKLVFDSDGNILLNIEGQDGTLNDKYIYLYGGTTYEEGVNPSFRFKHLTSVLYFDLTVPDGVTTLNNISLSNAIGGYNFYSVVSLITGASLKDFPSVFPDLTTSGDVVFSTLKKDNGEHVSVGSLSLPNSINIVDGHASFYYYILPSIQYDNIDRFNSYYDIAPKISAKSETGAYYVFETGYSRNIESGKQYIIRGQMNEPSPLYVNTNYIESFSMNLGDHYTSWGGSDIFQNKPYTIYGENTSYQKTFEGYDNFELPYSEDYYAVLPSNDNNECVDGEIIVTIPSYQNANSSNWSTYFDDSSIYNISRFGPYNQYINFYPANSVFSLYCPSVYEKQLTSVYVKSNNGEPLSGRMSAILDTNSSNVSVDYKGDGSDAVIMNIAGVQDCGQIVISVIPQILSGGYTIGYVYSDGTEHTYTWSREVVLQSGKGVYLSLEDLNKLDAHWNAQSTLPGISAGGKLDE